MNPIWKQKRKRIGHALAAAIAAVGGANALAADPTVIVSTLDPISSAPIALELNLPEEPGKPKPGWDTANVGQFFVRTGGRQKSLLPLDGTVRGRNVTISVDQPGPALLCIGVGPPEARGHSDSWQRTTHCTKIIFNVRPEDSEQGPITMANPGITGKTGQKIEILPLVDPTRLRQGDDLPVRVYYEGAKVAGARVTATVHQGGAEPPSVEVKAKRPTDAQGTTWLPVTHAGAWMVRFVHEVEGEAKGGTDPQQYVAELVFRVDGGEAQ